MFIVKYTPYRAHTAQRRADNRKKRGHKRGKIPNKKLRRFIFRQLRNGYSPEIIAFKASEENSSHLSPAVFNKNASHIETKNIMKAYDAAAQAFGNILQFKKAG